MREDLMPALTGRKVITSYVDLWKKQRKRQA